MPYATAADGTRLAYFIEGEGEPLVLVPGQGSDHHGWDVPWPDFAAHHRVISFDHRGTGESDMPRDEQGYATRNFARDVVAILDHLGIDRAHAYGVSMGGRICQWLAIDHPGRFGALVLGCTTPGNRHGVKRPPDVDALMANRPTDPAEALDFFLAQMVSPSYSEAHPDFVEAMARRFREPIPAFARKLHYMASEGHDTWDLLPSITNPVLVIHGTEDLVNPSANAPLLAGRIPGAELAMVEGGRHGYFIEFRPEASDIVLDFLRRHPL